MLRNSTLRVEGQSTAQAGGSETIHQDGLRGRCVSGCVIEWVSFIKMDYEVGVSVGVSFIKMDYEVGPVCQ